MKQKNILYDKNIQNNTPGSSCIIAEAGINHDGNFDKAKKLIIRAKKLDEKGKTEKALKRYEKALKYLLKSNQEKPLRADRPFGSAITLPVKNHRPKRGNFIVWPSLRSIGHWLP